MYIGVNLIRLAQGLVMYFIIQSRSTCQYRCEQDSGSASSPQWTWDFDNAKQYQSLSDVYLATKECAIIDDPVILFVEDSVIVSVYEPNEL